MDYRGEESCGGVFGAVLQARAGQTRPFLIAIPFYKNEHLVEAVIGSLLRCAGEVRALGAEAVFYIDSPDYAPLHEALQRILPAANQAFSCRIESNTTNLGFVRTMNKAVAEAVARGMDLLLLNSDTVLEPGALTEMAAAFTADHMIGFVNPRSNNATITTLPVRVPHGADRATLLAAAHDLANRLPRLSYIPTAVGFCLLVRWNILAEFGGFDEVYGQGYNEENDLVMRASRCGYRAVMANRAFVWHEGEESFATADIDRSVWEPANRAILDSRYPEYAAYTTAYYHTPETTTESLLAALQPDAQGRLDLAFDFSSFRPDHNGTFQAGRQLLQSAAVWADRYVVHVICTKEVYEFHDYAALGVPRCDVHEGRRFAAVFRVGQPYDWNVMQRLVVSAPVIGIYMLDTISIDCPQLTSARLYNIWQFALEHADLIATQSAQTQAQFAARFAIPDTAVQVVSRHSLDLADYVLPGAAGEDPASGSSTGILVIGNHFHHKYLSQTANAVAAAYPDREVVAMGLGRPGGRAPADPLAPPPLGAMPNLKPLPVGELPESDIGACYAACGVVVFPSHAEGFGFPVLNALAARRPVFLRRLPVFQELWEALEQNPNMHFYDTTAQLIAALAAPPSWIDVPPPPRGNGADRSAREIRQAVDAAIARADHGRIVRRIRAMQLASDLSDTGRPQVAHATQAAQVAQFLSLRVERVARRALAVGPVYQATRVMFRTARLGWRAVRRRK
jgi:GT2 family glycosyltransferase